MSRSSPYQPINCEVHDGYELACMRQAVHDVTWKDESGNQQTEKLRFKDLKSKDGQEYLIAESQSGESYQIRLDKITSRLPY